MNFKDRQIRRQYEQWISESFDSSTAFVTRTFKQGLKQGDGTWVRLSREIVSAQMCWLFRQLDRNVFGKAASRYNKRLARAVFIEGGDGVKHFHTHTIVEVPKDRMDEKRFYRLIDDIWSEAAWGAVEENQTAVYDLTGAVGYALKTGSDAFDPHSSHLPDQLLIRHSKKTF